MIYDARGFVGCGADGLAFTELLADKISRCRPQSNYSSEDRFCREFVVGAHMVLLSAAGEAATGRRAQLANVHAHTP